MAINNINALVDLEGLEKLNNSDYVTQYYNTGLANLGQRWTNEVLLEYLTFNVGELMHDRYPNFRDTTNGYLVITQKNKNSSFSKENIEFSIFEPPYQEKSNYQLNDFDGLSNDDNKSIIINKKISILKNLYMKVMDDIAKDNIKKDEDYGDDIYLSNDPDYKNMELWIPFDYNFEYVSDGINKTIIYGSNKSIYIYTEPEIIDNNPYNVISGILDSNGTYKIKPKDDVIFIKNPKISYEKISIYTFSFTFKSTEPNVLRGFVLPYVNEDNLWVINNKVTDISAKAENATNLNIVLAYLYKSGNNIQFNILSGLHDYVKPLNQLNKKKIYIKRHNGKTFDIDCYIPNIDKIEEDLVDYNNKVSADIVDILKNSTIILMTKLAKLIKEDDEDVKKEYKDGLITTIWKYKEYVNNETGEKCYYDYISIENDDEGHPLALDFADITNFSNLINYTVANIEQIEPDNYLHTHLIFDQIIKQNKQEVFNNYAYAVLQNIQGSDYNLKYVNNFNFTLRYVNNIIGNAGTSIDKVNNTTDNKYFTLPNNDEELPSLVTNSIYSRIVNNKTYYYQEFVPNYNVPIFDMSEFLTKDSNVMNKQNILSFASNGQVYYSYIGTPYDIIDKSIVHIGTANTNINLGEYSLVDDVTKSKFKKHTGLSIDFDNIYINGTTTIKDDLRVRGNFYYDKIDWNIKIMGNNKIYSTQIIPKFKYIQTSTGNIYHKINIDSMANKILNILNSISNESSKYYNNSEYLYCNIILEHQISNIDYYYKYNDLLYIDNLIKYLGLEDIQFDEIISNTNQIIYYNGIGRFMISSNNLLSDSINITSASDTKISISLRNLKEFYIGNPLDIVYINKNGINTLIINEHQTHKIKSIWKLPTQL